MNILKKEFEEFVKKEFPGKEYKWEFDGSSGFFYVQAGTSKYSADELHYEFYEGKVHLHIEGPNWRGIRNYLWNHVTDVHVSHKHWQRNGCDWVLDTEPKSWEEVKESFRQMASIFDSHIIEFERLITDKDMNNKQNKNIDAEIVSVGNMLHEEILRIPEYQRPYRWSEKNVRQLLEDIFLSKNAGKKTYRIGNVILYDNKEKNSLDIVDGQQRLTTLLILAKACGQIIPESLKYNHSDSITNIKNNYSFIQLWLDENCTGNEQEFYNYVKESCEFVRITVTDLSEAFQMFDSQNGRGKELEAYNLLKAYHIRAMDQDSQEEKVKCDKRWEDATQYDATPRIKDDPNIDVLKQLFEEQLYRSRMWSKKQEANEFSKKEIDEFKGFTIDKNHPAMFPYQNPQLLQYLTAKFYKNVLSGTVATQNRFINGDNERIDPFVNINQQIVNGKQFFDFVETYVEIYKRMFLDVGTYQLSEFKEFYYTYCLNYGDDKENRTQDFAFNPKYPATRSGDTYLREAYKSLVFVLFDKFGEIGLNKYYKVLYRLVYMNRFQKSQIRYKYVAQLPSEYFKAIAEAKDLSDLAVLNKLLETKLNENKTIFTKYNLKKIDKEEIQKFIIGEDKWKQIS